jgi:hypothetical protein
VQFSRAAQLYYVDSNETTSEISERKIHLPLTKVKKFWETNENENTELLNPNLKLKFDKTDVIHYGWWTIHECIFEVNNLSNQKLGLRLK